MHTRLIRRSFLIPLSLAFAPGCASVTGERPNVPTQVRTITSIGDRALPVVSGEPGTAVAAAVADPEPEPAAVVSRRVSGRVVDADGQPVADAVVRVAVDGSATGRSLSTRTDEAGRFALNNLREGSTYTVIAEAEDDRGAVAIGRRRVSAPHGPIEIALADRGAVAPARVGRVAARRATELDDPAPPVDEAASAAEAIGTAPASASSWRSGGRAGVMDPDDEGPNPLPPAIESQRDRERSRPGRTRAEAAAPPYQPAPGDEPPPPVFPGTGGSASSEPPMAADDRMPDPAPPAVSEELIDAALARPASSAAPGPATPAPAFPPPVETPAPTPPPMPTPTSTSVPADAVPALDVPAEPVPPPIVQPNSGPPPMSGDLLAEPPGDESGGGDGPPLVPPPEEPPAERPATVPETSAAAAPGPTWGQVAARPEPRDKPSRERDEAPPVPIRRVARAERPTGVKPAPAGPTAPVRAACRYDARHRRLSDFTLPNLDGDPLRFRELDADFVLLDFWGTWCGPCIQSIPHLVELQNRYGPERLKVVGIAYEHGEPGERAHNLAAAARKLNINYPVLVGEADGEPCPLRAAFHVQVYPTMVLLDREGNVLWRDQGATPVTLARLDRILATKARVPAPAQLARAGPDDARATPR